MSVYTIRSIYFYTAYSAKRDVGPVTPLGKGQCFSLHFGSASGSSYGVYMCWLACEDKVTLPLDLHVGPQRAFDGSECDIVSGDIASDSSDVEVLGGL